MTPTALPCRSVDRHPHNLGRQEARQNTTTEHHCRRLPNAPLVGTVRVYPGEMVEPLADTVARAERARDELNQLLEQLRAERAAVKTATTEAHEAIQGLRTAIREAREEMRQSGKAEARKYLARQMRAAAEILARES
jgi:hypothetical protein